MDGVAIITDLHLRASNTKTEPHLLEQQQILLDKIYNIVKDGSIKYEKMYVIILGDLTDRSISDSILFTKLCMYFKELGLIAKIYFVKGNHENTYKLKHNLFWHLSYGKELTKPSKIDDIEPIMEVTDYFDIGTTRIILNHHGETIQVPDSDFIKNIVVASHQNLSHQDLRDVYHNKDVDTQDEYVNYIDMLGFLPETEKLKYVFKGHQHMLFGCYDIKENWGGINYNFIFYDLSSLGRPKHNEFLQPNRRDIPVLEIDGDNINLLNNFIELYDASMLNLEEVEIRKDKYQNNKQFTQLRKTNFSATDVMSELRNLYSMDMAKTMLLEQAISGTVDPNVQRYMDIIKNIEVK